MARCVPCFFIQLSFDEIKCIDRTLSTIDKGYGALETLWCQSHVREGSASVTCGNGKRFNMRYILVSVNIGCWMLSEKPFCFSIRRDISIYTSFEYEMLDSGDRSPEISQNKTFLSSNNN